MRMTPRTAKIEPIRVAIDRNRGCVARDPRPKQAQCAIRPLLSGERLNPLATERSIIMMEFGSPVSRPLLEYDDMRIPCFLLYAIYSGRTLVLALASKMLKREAGSAACQKILSSIPPGPLSHSPLPCFVARVHSIAFRGASFINVMSSNRRRISRVGRGPELLR